MKKLFSVLVALLVASSAVMFAKGSRADIDKFIKEYEAFVVKVEKNQKTITMSEITAESEKIAKTLSSLEDNENITVDDGQKVAQLAERLSAALQKMTLEQLSK